MITFIIGFMSGDPDAQRDGTIGPDGYITSGQPRQKRIRTSFKHHQLRAMKSYFQLNHNPDAKDLKQLAQKTGLSKRVLQVNQSCLTFSIYIKEASLKGMIFTL
jgi:LIM homeobox protein 2/9